MADSVDSALAPEIHPPKAPSVFNLLEITHQAADAAFWIRAVWITLSYPEPEGQRVVIAKLAGLASQKSDDVYRQLEAALQGGLCIAGKALD